MFRKNAKVQWAWLGRTIDGVVEESYKESVTKTIKNKKITRHGSAENPAYFVKSEAGNHALKLESELKKPLPAVSKAKTKADTKSSPKMFG